MGDERQDYILNRIERAEQLAGPVPVVVEQLAQQKRANLYFNAQIEQLRAQTEKVPGIVREVQDHTSQLAALNEVVKAIPLIRQEMTANTEAFKAMRTAIYAAATAIVGAAAAVILLGH